MHRKKINVSTVLAGQKLGIREVDDGSSVAIVFDPSSTCAVERRDFPVGDKPTRQLSLRPVAIGAVVEVTKRLKPSV
jgi:hypothetical protein